MKSSEHNRKGQQVTGHSHHLAALLMQIAANLAWNAN
jgi:hypothetical protein